MAYMLFHTQVSHGHIWLGGILKEDIHNIMGFLFRWIAFMLPYTPANEPWSYLAWGNPGEGYLLHYMFSGHRKCIPTFTGKGMTVTEKCVRKVSCVKRQPVSPGQYAACCEYTYSLAYCKSSKFRCPTKKRKLDRTIDLH